MKSKLFDLEEDGEFLITLFENVMNGVGIEIQSFRGNLWINCFEGRWEIECGRNADLTFFDPEEVLDLLKSLEYRKFHLEIL